ncbi:hypothetical protein GCM10025863_19390 [Microbacterium suwonense]|uniref:Uncharacterized protein n=1 Tax=Microbacterium suwonense TaxID=683047 RepID=A0ABM8FUR5_9MICO|nr:hypothetical protein GCM10025863_19390 [Microbacterium suwonense]
MVNPEGVGWAFRLEAGSTSASATAAARGGEGTYTFEGVCTIAPEDTLAVDEDVGVGFSGRSKRLGRVAKAVSLPRA